MIPAAARAFAVAVDGTGQKVALPRKPPQRRNRTHAIAVSLQTARHSITGFNSRTAPVTPVPPHSRSGCLSNVEGQAGRKGPPY